MRGIWTVPQRLFMVRGFRRRRTAFREWRPHSGHAGLRGPAALASCPQPGRLQRATNFQNALFASIEVGHRLILREGAQSIDRVSGGCEHLLAEGVRHWASVSAACVAITGGPFCMGWPTLPCYLPLPEDPGTVSGFTQCYHASCQ